MKNLDKNQITVVGDLSKDYSIYYNNDVKMVEMSIRTIRTCKTKIETDVFVVNMPFDLYNKIEDFDSKIKITGEIRTYVRKESLKNRLSVVIFVKEIANVEGSDYKCEVNLEGTICRIDGVRTTPFGRKICDFIVASNYSLYKTAYVPCICWENLANKIKNQKVGTTILARGCLHSRKYYKTIDDIQEERTCYELSINDFCIVSYKKQTEEE